LASKGIILFDIDGVIRDVSCSYRLALQRTVAKFCDWEPTNQDIDSLKAEGCWNNDWDASFELIQRHVESNNLSIILPTKERLISSFSNFYFGDNPDGGPSQWNGLILNEPLLVGRDLFQELSNQKICWGFVSGAEPPSAKFVIESRLNLKGAPLLAMGDAPEKPDPRGLITLSRKILSKQLGPNTPPIAYIGDTVADVLTVKNARKHEPTQSFLSIAVAPPHLHHPQKLLEREIYERMLKDAGADIILQSTKDIVQFLSEQWKD